MKRISKINVAKYVISFLILLDLLGIIFFGKKIVAYRRILPDDSLYWTGNNSLYL